MTNNKRPLDNIWIIVFYVGYFLVLLISLNILLNLSFESQPVLAITLSFAYIISSFLFARIPNKPEKLQNHHIKSFWVGIAEIILAILFWTVIKPRTEIALWGTAINLILGTVGIINAYGAIVYYFFPKILQTVLAPKIDHVSEFPQNLQEIMARGRNWVAGSSLSIIFFFLIGVIGNTIRIVNFNDESNNFFLVSLGIGFLVTFSLCYVVTIKWQRWARQTGIPEEELKEAAKSVGLWWPQTGNKS